MISDGGDLRPLYEAHLRYMQDLASDAGQEWPVRNYVDFVGWWHELSPAVKLRFERNYRRGYAATIQEGKQKIAEVVFAEKNRDANP
jgi:hypothetical protein